MSLQSQAVPKNILDRKNNKGILTAIQSDLLYHSFLFALLTHFASQPRPKGPLGYQWWPSKLENEKTLWSDHGQVRPLAICDLTGNEFGLYIQLYIAVFREKAEETRHMYLTSLSNKSVWMYEKEIFLRKGIVCVGQFQKSLGFLDEFVALVFHFWTANSQQNRGTIYFWGYWRWGSAYWQNIKLKIQSREVREI